MSPHPVTPLEKIALQSGRNVFVKRDDKIEGTKLRLINFLKEQLSKKPIQKVITIGTRGSNQCYYLAKACEELGKDFHIFYHNSVLEGFDFNFNRTKELGPEMTFLSDKEWALYPLKIKAEQKKLAKEEIESMFIPFGCGTPESISAIEEFGEELLKQSQNPDSLHILVPTGSGTTLFGLDLYFQKLGKDVQLWGYLVESDVKSVQQKIKKYYLDYNKFHQTKFLPSERIHLLSKEEIMPSQQSTTFHAFKENFGITLDPKYHLRAFNHLKTLLDRTEEKDNIIAILSGLPNTLRNSENSSLLNQEEKLCQT